jgi:ribulose-bisphosphate carboxylase small chain
MRLTQGTFSFLPDLTREQIRAQIAYCLDKGWAVSIEYTSDPHPRNTYWEMWSQPMFDLKDPAGAMTTLDACRNSHADKYVKVNAFDSTHGWEALRLSFIVNRPKEEPGFSLVREEGEGRRIRYTTHAYVTDRPEDQR